MTIKASKSSFSVARKALEPVKVTKLPSFHGSALSRYVVSTPGGLEIGLIEKFKDDRSTINPWKAYSGIGATCKYIGCFYKEEGGREAAINAVVNS